MKEKQINLIATHNGNFHSDEIFAIAILRKLFPHAKVIRTRDPKLWEKADIRVDVCGKYNPENYDFDHHQRDFKETNKSGISYSSCGLIWKHFGRKLVDSDEAFERIRDKMIEFIDAQDVGFNYSLGNVEVYTISHAIGSFDNTDDEEDQNIQFEKAISIASQVLDNELSLAKDFKESLDNTRKAIKNNPFKGYIILKDSESSKELLVEEKDLLYSIMQRPDGNWNSQAITKKKGMFGNKKDFPKEWGGLTGEEFEKVSGVKGAVFCHRNLFLCAAKTKEGAIELTKKAIEY